MRRIFLPISLLMLLLVTGWRGREVLGQTSSNTLTGSWNATITSADGSTVFPILMTFHADGTATIVLPGFGDGVGVGAWAMTGDGQYAMTTLHFDQNPPPNKNPLNGYLKLRASFTVSGNTLTGTAESIQTDLTGAVAQHATGVTVAATQIGVEPIGAQ